MEEELKERIEELKKYIKPYQDEIKEIESKLKEIKIKKVENEILSKIRVGSKIYIPMECGSGYKLTVTKIEVKESKNKFNGKGYYVEIEAIKKNGNIFKYECPYKNGEFYYRSMGLYFKTREIIIKEY